MPSRIRPFRLFAPLFCIILAQALVAGEKNARQSAREIPVAAEVDVVVVGGSTGAVAAAVAAAENGATVFLAAPRPYLGDDMTATLRLWLEGRGQPTSPLAQRIFNDPNREVGQNNPNGLVFTYSANVPCAGVHRDTKKPSLLTDGRWSDPKTQSVQYDSNVTITADLGQTKPIEQVRLRAFHRASGLGGSNFKVAQVTVFISDDAKTWKKGATIENNQGKDDVRLLKTDINTTARYVKFVVEKTDDVDRILLGEIEIVGKSTNVAKPLPKHLPPRPMHVKRVLDEALLAAGVQFLYSCQATDTLVDENGKLCGIVMANRAGRQAVIAKMVVDATDGAIVARKAGAPFEEFRKRTVRLRRVVIGGEPKTGPNMTHRIIDPPFPGSSRGPSRSYNIIEYALDYPLEDASFASYVKADQHFRTLTYDPDQQFTSDALIDFPFPDIVREDKPLAREYPAEGSTEPRISGKSLPLGYCRPKGCERLFVLGWSGDLYKCDTNRRILTRAPDLIDLGARIGQAAAAEAKTIAKPKGVNVLCIPLQNTACERDVREPLAGPRSMVVTNTVTQAESYLPVLGEYDVVVVGGGTAGAPAGIAAARSGAKTLVVEYLHGLGGVGTQGAIAKYYWGNRVGFTATVPGKIGWPIEQKMEWWRSELLDAGADIWFGTIGCGAYVETNRRGHFPRVRGIVVATPQGRGIVLAKVVIDATGNADIAAAAGVQCSYTDHKELAMQGTGLPPRNLGAGYTNTDFSIVDETDMLDVWHFFVYAKQKYPNAFDQGKLIDTRERRRIRGAHTITLRDQLMGRTWPDTIVRTRSNFDTHGYTIDPVLEIAHPDHAGFFVNVPYRCLLPVAPFGPDGIIIAGIAASVHRDALPLTRMQPDIQNQGYAAGLAAAMAAKESISPRSIDIRELQKKLIAIGNLPESVLTDKDSMPLSKEQVAKAVKELHGNVKTAAIVLTHPKLSLELLKNAHAQASGKEKITYAQTLAIMGDKTGVPTLIEAVEKAEKWDKGWNYRGMGQYGSALSELDRLVVALGRSGDRRAVDVILKKAKLLSAEHDFSHHRAVAMALEMLDDSRAAKPLAELLKKPDMSGHVHDTIEKAAERDRISPGGTNAEKTRRESLRELFLARALYRCGDQEDIGKHTLEAYTKDLRGHLARHAMKVLWAP